MKKIIGFILSSEKIDFQYDVFQVGLSHVDIYHNGYHLKIWGIGDLRDFSKEKKFNLSNKANKYDLFDRNVIIELTNTSIHIENDWLGSIPIFYNNTSQIISTVPNVCLKNKKLNTEGIADYLKFGYSVFGNTIFDDVQFLRYYSKIECSQGIFKIEEKKDVALKKILNKTGKSDVNSVINVLENYINEELDDKIILPLSGGYDSRLLAHLVRDKTKIKAFTYGISTNQEESSEVVNAREVAKKLKLSWNWIQLNNTNSHISQWFKLFGFSTHLHGMYHIEFYQKIKNIHPKGFSLLSGIFGDIWCGSIPKQKISNQSDVLKLAFAHELKISDQAKIKTFTSGYYFKDFFEKHKKYLDDHRYQNLMTIRLKMILISYLTTVPEYFGWPSSTPFLSLNVVREIINLPSEERHNRKWLKTYFKKINLDIDETKLKSRKENNLDYQMSLNYSFEPLALDIFDKIYNVKQIKKINKKLASNPGIIENILCNSLELRKIGSILRGLGFKNNRLTALIEYYILKPIEKSMRDVN